MVRKLHLQIKKKQKKEKIPNKIYLLCFYHSNILPVNYIYIWMTMDRVRYQENF